MPNIETIMDIWAEYNERTVTIDGDTWIVCVREYLAKYPYERVVTNISLAPTGATRATESYRTTRRELGDDWFKSIVSENHFNVELAAEVLEQL